MPVLSPAKQGWLCYYCTTIQCGQYGLTKSIAAKNHASPSQPAHVVSAARGLLPSNTLLDQNLNALSQHLQQSPLLVLDDVHLVSPAFEIAHLRGRMIGLAPANLHLLVATRPPLKLPNPSRSAQRTRYRKITQSSAQLIDQVLYGIPGR